MTVQPQDQYGNSEEQRAAQKALFGVITKAVAGIEANQHHKPHEQVVRIRELATAYRLVAGGAQPGSITVEK